MYLLLSGAKRNVGDFLILSRTVALLQFFKPHEEIVVQPSWLPLAITDNPKAIIIAGGPGFRRNFYPKTYPLIENLASLGCPLIPFGVGWKGFPGDLISEKRYRFTARAQEALRWISQQTKWLGCRDLPTQRVLNRTGVRNTLMVGCPVWYHLPSLGKRMHLPETISTLVFTPPQNLRYFKQSLRIIDTIAALFPDSKRICSFHRGIDRRDLWSSEDECLMNGSIARYAADHGFEIYDASGSESAIDFYSSCDLHIGYRLHGHLNQLSMRRPSLLLHEDGRGVGASESLNLAGIDASQRTRHHCRVDPEMGRKLTNQIRNDLKGNFIRYENVPRTIDDNFNIVRLFMESLP
jgi:hypothetical protein